MSTAFQVSHPPAEPASIRRRVRSPTEADIEAASVNSYGKRRKLDPEHDSHRNWGRVLGRVIDTYNRPYSIIMTGLQFESLADNETTVEISQEDHDRRNSYSLAIKHIPELDNYLCNPDNNDRLDDLGKHMKEGQDGAHSDDTATIKFAIIEMLQLLDPQAAQGLKPNIKDNRGFHHNLTGRLLCPAYLDWSDNEVSRSLKSGESRPDSTDWPLFFYQNLLFNPADQMEGLLKGSLLVWTYKCIFLGPSAWQPGKTGKGSGKRASKSAGANMEAVTPGSIAYAAKFAYFGLSSAETNRKQGGEFDFSPMYWQIVWLFEEQYLKDDTTALLQWWNQQIFPLKSAAKTAAQKKENPIARLMEQKRAKMATGSLTPVLGDRSNLI